MAEWSDWSVCLRDGVTCGFRWGKQTRTRGGRQTGKTPEEQAAASHCPSHNETQRCRMKKKCSTGEIPCAKKKKTLLFVYGCGVCRLLSSFVGVPTSVDSMQCSVMCYALSTLHTCAIYYAKRERLDPIKKFQHVLLVINTCRLTLTVFSFSGVLVLVVVWWRVVYGEKLPHMLLFWHFFFFFFWTQQTQF